MDGKKRTEETETKEQYTEDAIEKRYHERVKATEVVSVSRWGEDL